MKNYLLSTTALRSPEGIGGGSGGISAPNSGTGATGVQTQDVTAREGDIDNTNLRQNNTGVNEDILADLWGSDSRTGNKNEQRGENEQQRGSNEPGDPQTQINGYLNSIGLGSLTLTADERQQFLEGNPEGALNKINSQIQNAYLQMMKTLPSLLEKTVEQAVSRANQNTTDRLAADGFRGRLYKELPFVEDPIISPVALGVAQKLFAKGLSEPKVIEGVKEYFARISKSAGYVEDGPNSNFNGNFNTRRGKEVNWLDLLTEK